MKKKATLSIELEESEIQAIQKLPEEEWRKIQEQVAQSIQNGLLKLGLVESKSVSVVLEEHEEDGETVPFVFVN